MNAVSEIAFRQALLDAAAPIPDGLRDGHDRPAGRRYAVYRNNVAVSLREALATGFPAVVKLIGDENFAKVAGLYLRKEPPTSPLMMHYGRGFPDFLASFPPLSHIGYLADVARLDLAMRRSYHAADADPFDPAVFQGLSDDTLMAGRLRLAPSVVLVRSPWPVFSVWQFSMRDGAPKPQAEAEDVMITRPEFDPDMHKLPSGGGAFLQAVQTGAHFGAALDAAGEDFDLGAMLGLMLETQALTALDLEGEVSWAR